MINTNIIQNKIGVSRKIIIITPTSAEDAIERCRAASALGVNAAEIVFRNGAAESVLRAVASTLPYMLIGAGTILTYDDAMRAIESGAQFIISPGATDEVANACAAMGVPYIPGVATPTEITNAVNLGFKILKLFPAKQLGGAGYIDAIAPVFPTARFIPTGGVDAENAAEYLSRPNVFAVAGSKILDFGGRE
ncbi:MAG: bifunctional 4-hydroxy-2-oxoglutarate aldolase/2-dehydro-3-deoxy-phosphogluconate aldolase [Oscillospiraceae bacterium]|jgi:2-dehydro-3-deoxyphosphogluconate aldolase/(4S)-4-hydroxy-2-oxoglutarate aldolase|nr:bifunctional 4-hydroxy-2-oxoglutarate aldolase/2-dehydro-3-deoxy-phosphogluconate aldolase [Oscillospiraceae bacterium]